MVLRRSHAYYKRSSRYDERGVSSCVFENNTFSKTRDWTHIRGPWTWLLSICCSIYSIEQITPLNVDRISGEVFAPLLIRFFKGILQLDPMSYWLIEIDLCTSHWQIFARHILLIICSTALEMMSLEVFMPPCSRYAVLWSRICLPHFSRILTSHSFIFSRKSY